MPNQRWIIVTLMLATLMASLDSSIVNVSLPVMRSQFNAGLDDVQWVVTAYMLGFCVFMPLTNYLKERLGFLNLLIGALLIFTTGSLLCGLSRNLETLIASRALQAFGGGAITPTVLSIMSLVFPKNKRGSALSWWGIGSLMGPALGPTLGGIITQEFGWPYIFFINIPVCIITIFLAIRYLGFLKTMTRSKPKFDIRGFISLSIFLVGLQYGIARMERAGGGSIEVLTTFALAFLSFIYFLLTESKRDSPIMELSLFRNPVFVQCELLTAVRSAALFGGIFLLPFLFQGLMGYSELQSGMLLLPGSIGTAIMTPISGRWADKHGSRNILLLALVLLSLSMFSFSMTGVGTSMYLLIFAVFVRGLGIGMLITPLTTATVNSVHTDQVTMASSVNSLTLQLSGSLGIAMLAIIHTNTLTRESIALGNRTLAEHLALQRGFWVSSALVAVALIPAYLLPKGPVSTSPPVPVTASVSNSISATAVGHG
jgi:DHA2 family multidrug resistance protein